MKDLLQLRLYVAGDSPHSVAARANLDRIARDHLPPDHDIEIIDVVGDPGRALADGVFLTPALVRVAPLPKRVIVGNLTDTRAVLSTLNPEDEP